MDILMLTGRLLGPKLFDHLNILFSFSFVFFMFLRYSCCHWRCYHSAVCRAERSQTRLFQNSSHGGRGSDNWARTKNMVPDT